MDTDYGKKKTFMWLYIQQQNYIAGYDHLVWGYGDDMVSYLFSSHRRVKHHV